MSSLTQLVELLDYDDLDDSDIDDATKRRMRIHNNKIPANKFRATVRVSKSGSKSALSNSGSKEKQSPSDADASGDWTNYFDQDSPNSFPSTPTSRAKYMAYSEV